MSDIPFHFNRRKSVVGGENSSSQKYYGAYVTYCEKCLHGEKIVCQYGLKHCEEKELWTAFVEGRKQVLI